MISALHRVSSYTDTFGKTIRYAYDAAGNLDRLTYPDNTAVSYDYDETNRLRKVTDWAGRVTSYTYDANGKVTGITRPDGSTTATVYDDCQRVVSTVEKTASGVVISGFAYEYDDLGRIISENHLAEAVKICYTYDSLSRVTKRTTIQLSDNSQSEEVYTYDAAGNIVGDGSDCGFVYDTNNRLTSYDGNAVEYDMDGNMTSVVLEDEITDMAYDSANRLTSAGANHYTYDAEDVRIRNLCGSEDTTYTYNTNCKLSQLLTKTTNGVVTKYVYGLGLIGEESGGAFKTYHFDNRGSTVAITNTTGKVTDAFRYDTYGRMTEHVGDSEVIFGYNGRDGVVTDKNGLIYMRARYYSPELRRFVNADVVAGKLSNAITLNRYAYANGNPVSNIDPFGLSADRGDAKQEKWYEKLYNQFKDAVVDGFNWTVDQFKKLTAEGKLDPVILLAIGAEKDENGIYHIKQDYWQSWHFVGYNDFYDWAFGLGTRMTGTSMAADKFEFTVDGTRYIIWVWKGDYINLGSGAELGIYRESPIPGHWYTATESALPMTLSLMEKDTGKVLFDYAPTENQWWITGFDASNQNAQADNLQATYTIDFSGNEAMYNAFKEEWGEVWSFDGMVATLQW